MIRVPDHTMPLLAEVSRLFFRARIRMLLIIGFAAAGLIARAMCLVAQARAEALAGGNITPLSSWHSWCLIVSFVVAVTYFVLAVGHLENALGVFLLPLVLVLIGSAVLVGDVPRPRTGTGVRNSARRAVAAVREGQDATICRHAARRLY